MTDWLCPSGLPSSWFTWSVCLYAQWSASFATSNLHDTVSYSIHASVKAEKGFPQTDLLHSFDCLGWLPKQCDCLPRHLLPLFLSSPGSLWSCVTSSWKVPGVVQVPQPTAGWMQRVGRLLTGEAASSKIKTRVAWTDLFNQLLVIPGAACKHPQPYLPSGINTVTTFCSVAIEYNYMDKC